MAAAPVRGTQSFVHTLSLTWRSPGLTLREIAWRWAYGIPALALVLWQGRRALLVATEGTLDPAQVGLDKALLNDPVGALTANTMSAAGKFGEAFQQVWPALEPALLWVLPLLLLGWIAISSVGRNWVARAADPTLKPHVATLMGLQAVRTGALLALVAGWLWGLSAASEATVSAPLAHGGEPNLVGLCAAVIVLSLTLFTGWAAVSWVLGVAPLLAMLEGYGVFASIRAATRLGALRGKLVEVNLVLGIVKIILVVLAMVFSATPLPFEAVTTQGFLLWWWGGVTLLYLLWSDFFHVARLLGYLQLWHAVEGVERATR